VNVDALAFHLLEPHAEIPKGRTRLKRLLMSMTTSLVLDQRSEPFSLFGEQQVGLG
jgi:hypothetical protein